MDIILVFATLLTIIALVISVAEYFKTRSNRLQTHPADWPAPTGSKVDFSRLPRSSAESIESSRIDISRLPRPSAELVGRNNELTLLTNALNNEKQYFAYLCAGGGVGKSALTFTWLQNMQPKYHNIKKVLAWSFYSQGSHDTQNSSVPFFQVALPFFGFAGELPKEDVAKGRALARCLREKSFILVLDGLEPLQHPTHILDGELKDVAIKAFLDEVYFCGLAQPPSLIVISSRQPLVELTAWSAERYITIDLQTLPKTDGAKLLTQLGVKGTTTELEQASEEMGGHALALVLLGRMLVKQFAGKIERRDRLHALWEEEKLGGHALRVLRCCEDYYAANDSINNVFLDLLSLFNRPMGPKEKDVLVEKAEYAAPLRALDDVGWEQLERTLENAGVLLRSDGTRTHWDCHPLIRSYFAQRFKETRLQQYQQAQRVLFDYYQSVPAKHQPDTLEELEPLYRAVVHGCLAEEYQKALEVYDERILRGKEYYSQNKLGAYSQDLTVLAAFFPHGWSHPVQQGLSEANQAWLLAATSFGLMSLGRLTEAVEPRTVSLKIVVKQEDWRKAAIYARNLAELMQPLGRLTEATQAAQQALDEAVKSGDLFEQTKSHATLATVLHQQGDLALAAQAFTKAEQLQAQRQPDSPQLYSIWGFQYCALLLDQAQSVAEYEAVLGRGEYALNIVLNGSRALFDIALNHLTLARVLTQLQRDNEAASSFDQAVAGIRKAGRIDHLAYFLIDRANFHLRPSRLNLDAAAHDLQEADSLIRRCGMKLYAVDCQLAWCRYYLAREEKETARECWKQAKMGMEVTGYGLRAGVVRELGEKI